MLPQSRRLRAAEVARVLSAGKPLRGKYISGKALREGATMRVAVAVPKTAAKRAVARNRLRRLLYRLLGEHSLPALPYQVVFLVRSVPEVPEEAFKIELASLLSSLR